MKTGFYHNGIYHEHKRKARKDIFLLMAIFILFTGCSLSQSKHQNFDIKKISVGKGAGSVEIEDINKDHLPDIIVANSEDSSVTILLNRGNRIFMPSDGSPFYAGHFPNDINIADFNKDGNVDLAFANHEKKFFTVLLGSGKGQFYSSPNSAFNVQVKPHTHGVISATSIQMAILISLQIAGELIAL